MKTPKFCRCGLSLIEKDTEHDGVILCCPKRFYTALGEGFSVFWGEDDDHDRYEYKKGRWVYINTNLSIP